MPLSSLIVDEGMLSSCLFFSSVQSKAMSCVGRTFVDRDEEKDKMECALLMCAFMDCAVRLAAQYTKHAGRKVVTTRDIRRGLMYEAMVKFATRDPDTIKQKVQEVKDFIDEDAEEHGSDVEDGEDFTEEYCDSYCLCMDCDRMNTVEIEWESWVPPSPVLTLLKAAIDRV